MKLDHLCEVFDARFFPEAEARAHPERDSVLAARSAVATAVCDDEFLVDCMAHELSLVEGWVPRRGLVPFLTMPDLGIHFAFGYWRPGSMPGPHEHTAWTITAVCRNELAVLTYDRDESYRRKALVPKNRFDAAAGRVGFIYEPCIHNPQNITDRWSLSFHVTSPRDGEPLGDHDSSLPMLDEFIARVSPPDRDDPYTWVVTARQRQIVIRQVAHFLASVDLVHAGDLLDRCVRLGTSATRQFVDHLRRTDDWSGQINAPWVLARTHQDLPLGHRTDGDTVALGVETPQGWVEEVAMSSLACDAIAFAAREPAFDVRQLPGKLYEEDRWAIAEALEETGLFTREPRQ